MNSNVSQDSYLIRSKAYKGYHYSVLKPEMLLYLHHRVMEMYLEIAPILKKNSIRYMMCGGSLLGAYTRKTLFDWDEDLDLCVLDEDYDKMVEVLSKEFNGNCDKNIMIQCVNTDPGYYLDWVKVRDTKSHVYPDLPTTCYNGVWIDIYRLISVKEGEAGLVIAEGQLNYHKRRFERGGFTEEEYKERLKKNHLEEKVQEEKIKADKSDKRSECYLVWSANKTLIRKEWVLPLKEYTLEGIDIPSFGNAEQYLLNHYGDLYYELPPEELRRVGINRIEYQE